MNDEELCALLDRHLKSATSVSGQLSGDQASALDLYHGRPLGNEIEGRSQVKTREVLESVEWAKPSLLRIFGSAQKFGQFDPTGAEDEDAAEQETDAVHHVLLKDNDWYLFAYEYIHTQLVEKNAYAKVYAEESNHDEIETYYGQTDWQMQALLADTEPLEHTEYVEPTDLGPVLLHDIKVKREKRRWVIRVETVPNEEMRIPEGHRKISLEDVPFVAHVRSVPKSDLIEMRIDPKKLEDLGEHDDEFQLDTHRSEYDNTDEDEETDDSMRLITVEECYVRMDSGNGVAELRRVLKSGNVILENDEWEMNPFVASSPKPQPNTHIGMSWADLSADIQINKTTLLRQILDNLYLTNNPEKEVLDGKVNYDDLLTSQPGGLKRVKQVGSINQLTVPFTAAASVPMLEMLDSMGEARSGISRHTQGLDADALAQSTKGAFMGAMKQANQQLEMVARNMAEIGFKQIFLKAHALILKYQDVPRTIKIRNKWVEVNPSEWKERSDMTVQVGTGNLNDDEQLSKLMALAQKQEEHLMKGSPLVTPNNLYNTYELIVEKAGLKDVSRFFTDPSMAQPKPEQPSDNDKLIAAQKEIEGLKAQLKSQELELKRDELTLKEREQHRKEIETGYDMATDRTEQELKYGMNVPGAVV